MAATLLGAGAAHAGAWIFTVGAQAGVSPPYEGADRDILEPSPTFDLRPASAPQRFTPPDGGTTITLMSTHYFEFGPMARFRYDRDPTGELRGFDKIKWAAEPGVFLDLWPTDWLRARVEGRRGVTGHLGWIGDAGLDLIYNGPRWAASVGPRIGYGDQHYMQTYFGVTPSEAERSPFIKDVYTPKAGQRYMGVETAISYRLSRHWRTTFDIGYQQLVASAAESPIVRKVGSTDQYSSSLGFSYAFQIGR